MNNDNSLPVAFDGEELFVLQGAINQLHLARSSVNLLEKIEENLASKNSAAGIIAALTGMHGVLASSMTLSMYDGEETFNFAGIIDDKVVFGSFALADKIKNNDVVKAVVAKRGDAFYIHSLVRVADDLMMLPLSTFAGDRAFFKNCMKFAWRCCIFLWLVFFFAFYFMGTEKFFQSSAIPLIVSLCFLMPLFCFPFEYRTYKSMKYYGLYASAIFKTLDLPRPDDLDARIGMTHYRDEGYGFGGINLKFALEKHMKKFNIK